MIKDLNILTIILLSSSIILLITRVVLVWKNLLSFKKRKVYVCKINKLIESKDNDMSIHKEIKNTYDKLLV